jgi:peptidoglycan hydrolase CwlO-like protein
MTRRPRLLKKEAIEMAPKTEAEDLNLHVSLCAERFGNIQSRLDSLDARISTVENKVSSIKTEMQTGFSEIKLLIEQQHSSKTNQVIVTLGSIVCAMIAALGYVLTR